MDLEFLGILDYLYLDFPEVLEVLESPDDLEVLDFLGFPEDLAFPANLEDLEILVR